MEEELQKILLATVIDVAPAVLHNTSDLAQASTEQKSYY